jgi:hypothetical protein
MSICNRQGTMAAELREISTQLSSFCRVRGIEVGAAHIAGVLNGFRIIMLERIIMFRTDNNVYNWLAARAEHLSLRLSVAYSAIDHPPLGHLLLLYNWRHNNLEKAIIYELARRSN